MSNETDRGYWRGKELREAEAAFIEGCRQKRDAIIISAIKESAPDE